MVCVRLVGCGLVDDTDSKRDTSTQLGMQAVGDLLQEEVAHAHCVKR
ncbi:MAG: hypothetical protein QF570_18915 [Myxococcota bacterium]|nr:hypothetical protein [Myxococcota bacterium]